MRRLKEVRDAKRLEREWENDSRWNGIVRDYPNTSFVTTRAYLKSHPDVVKKFLMAMATAVRELKQQGVLNEEEFSYWESVSEEILERIWSYLKASK